MLDLWPQYPNMPVSAARRQFSYLVHSVAFNKSRVLLTNHSQPVVGVVPIDDVRALGFADQQKRSVALEKAAKHDFYRDEPRVLAESLDASAMESLSRPPQPAIGNRGPDMEIVGKVLADLQASDHAPDHEKGHEKGRLVCQANIGGHLQEAMRLTNAIMTFLVANKNDRGDPQPFDQQVRNGLTLQEHLLSIQRYCAML